MVADGIGRWKERPEAKPGHFSKLLCKLVKDVFAENPHAEMKSTLVNSCENTMHKYIGSAAATILKLGE